MDPDEKCFTLGDYGGCAGAEEAGVGDDTVFVNFNGCQMNPPPHPPTLTPPLTQKCSSWHI